MQFDQKNRIPAQIAHFMAHRVTDRGQNEFQVRWQVGERSFFSFLFRLSQRVFVQGYGEGYDTWEPERNLGDRLDEARELFQLENDSEE